jgi:hypothetical protein
MSTYCFGKMERGTAIHFVKGTKKEGYVARCNGKPIVEIVASTKDNIDKVTCSKCKRFADYKNFVEKKNPNLVEEKIAEEKYPEVKENKQLEREFIPDFFEKGINSLSDSISVLVESVKGIQKKIEKHDELITNIIEKPTEEAKENQKENDYGDYKEKLKDSISPEENKTVKGNQFQEEKLNNGKYNIIHIASNTKVFSGIEENIVKTVVKYLNNIKVRWENKNDPIPKDFATSCAAAYKAACRNHGVDCNVEEKPQKMRSIKRRDKKTRVIKRRGSNKTDEFGFRVNSSRSEIAYMIKDGSHYVDMFKYIKHDGEKDLISTIKLVIRKLVSRGYPIMTIQQKDRNLDYYHIVEPIE